MNTDERVLWAGGHGVLLLLVLAGIAFVSGYWAILLALGPAAYVLVIDARNSDNAPKGIIINYIAALVTGWGSYLAIARGISPMTMKPMSELGLRVIGSALVAFAIMTGIFYVLYTQQPMAYVAAFTAAIGALPTIQSLMVAVITVLLMAGIQAIRRRYGPQSSISSEQVVNEMFYK